MQQGFVARELSSNTVCFARVHVVSACISCGRLQNLPGAVGADGDAIDHASDESTECGQAPSYNVFFFIRGKRLLSPF